jgi:hypothetical protein
MHKVMLANLPRVCSVLAVLGVIVPARAQTLFPPDQATLVNPDVQLKLTFKDVPRIGASGKIRIYDAADGRLVDLLDMSIPPGPTQPVDPAVRAKNYLAFPYPYARASRPTNANTKPGTPSAGATPTSDQYQLTIIGGFTDGFHFYPITVDGHTATIHPHHDLLDYGKTYYVVIDRDVFAPSSDNFSGITGKRWRFTTKPKSKAPRPDAERLVVSADGAGDFNTVQGAMDFVPDHAKKRITITVRNGLYEEIVYFRNKDNVTLLGESQDRTIIRYANNEVFNPHPANIRTNPAHDRARAVRGLVDHWRSQHPVACHRDRRRRCASGQRADLHGGQHHSRHGRYDSRPRHAVLRTLYDQVDSCADVAAQS